MKVFEAEVAFPYKATLGEGSLWDARHRQLYWVDIYENKVCLFDPERHSNLVFDVGANVGTVVPTEQGPLLTALRHEIAGLDLDTGDVFSVATPCAPVRGVRFNDGKCDPEGRFWVGTMVESGPQGGGSLYMLGHDLGVSEQLSGLTISNGLAWFGRRFYHIDTPSREVRGFDYEPTSGRIANPTLVKSFASEMGAPDGMCVDAEGMLWVALWGGHAVVRIHAQTGEVLAKVELPAANVTSCAFGGPDLDVLYVTSARIGVDPEQLDREPLSGSLFRATLPYQGLVAPAFRGRLPR